MSTIDLRNKNELVQNEIRSEEKNAFRYAVSLIPAQTQFANSARSDVHDMSMFEAGLKNGTIKNINASDDLGWTFLHYAAARNNADAIKFLINHGADMEQKNREDKTPLFIATIMENLDAIKELVKFGANCDVRDVDGYHLLFVAEKKKMKEISDILQIDARKETVDIYENPKFEKMYRIELQKTLQSLKIKTK